VNQKPCTEGGDLHWPKAGSWRQSGDGSSTAVCGDCGRDLYASALGLQWKATNHLPTMTCVVCERVAFWMDDQWVHPIYKGEKRPPDHPPVFYLIKEEPA
jgi:hypothetical protein